MKGPNDHGLTCDLGGCEEPGYARYRHIDTHEWIDVCAMHRPQLTNGVVCNSAIYYHTAEHRNYPAETVAGVNRPDAFKRTAE